MLSHDRHQQIGLYQLKLRACTSSTKVKSTVGDRAYVLIVKHLRGAPFCTAGRRVYCNTCNAQFKQHT